MDTREAKGLNLSREAKIEKHKSYWAVPSTSALGNHRVSLKATDCTCGDFELRRLPCKHIFAVKFVMEREQAAAAGSPQPVPAAIPIKRKTYKQDWPNYNAAQMGEKRLFLQLLADLCHNDTHPAATHGQTPIHSK